MDKRTKGKIKIKIDKRTKGQKDKNTKEQKGQKVNRSKC